jgi:hypothetical protein
MKWTVVEESTNNTETSMVQILLTGKCHFHLEHRRAHVRLQARWQGPEKSYPDSQGWATWLQAAPVHISVPINIFKYSNFTSLQKARDRS